MRLLVGFVFLNLILSSKAAPRIIGGSDAPDGAYPYQVAIKYNGEFMCGGSILNKRCILTAAHCLFGSYDKYDIVVGLNLLNDTNGQVYHVDQFVVHEKFYIFLTNNDIGMMHVDRDIEFNDKIQPVALPKENFKSDTYATLTGWGFTDYEIEEENGTSPNKLQYLVVKTISNEECKNSSLGHYITDFQLCALTKKGEGACKHDSGGPLVADGNVQIGIVSLGDPCALGSPDVYTNVYKYLDWIEKQIAIFEMTTFDR